MLGVLHGVAKGRGLAAASLWAAVPHYAAAVPNPKAALALIRRLEGLIGIPLDAGDLEDASVASRSRSARRSPPTPRSTRWSSGSRPSRTISRGSSEDVPSGDAIARDFQDFLRRQAD